MVINQEGVGWDGIVGGADSYERADKENRFTILLSERKKLKLFLTKNTRRDKFDNSGKYSIKSTEQVVDINKNAT